MSRKAPPTSVTIKHALDGAVAVSGAVHPAAGAVLAHPPSVVGILLELGRRTGNRGLVTTYGQTNQ